MKTWLGKSAVTALHYSRFLDSIDSIDWLTYERSDDVNDNIEALIRTALTYSAIATDDLIIDSEGQLWRISQQSIEAVGGAPTLRNAEVTAVSENAKAVIGDRIVAVSSGGYAVGDTVTVSPVDGSPAQATEYTVTVVAQNYQFGNFYAQRLQGVAA